jgi:NPCBM/NEW2 domain
MDMTYILLTLVTLISQVDANLLDGTQVKGELKSLSSEEALFVIGKEEKKVPVSSLLEIIYPESDESDSDDKEILEIQLTDETSFFSNEVLIENNDVLITSPDVGKTVLHLDTVSNIRLGAGDNNIIDSWEILCSRNHKQDLLVIRKGDILDHLDGTITSITKEKINFLLDGSEISANRKKIFGLIYARKPIANTNSVCKAVLQNSSIMNLASIIRSVDDSFYQAELSVGGEIKIPIDSLKRLDFSLGKIQYLSDMKPVEVVYTPFFDVKWEYQKDRNMDGGPIRLERKKYEKGLCIHSKTYLRYRLAGNYRRFQAVMGIDDSVKKLGNVHVVISADTKQLIKTDVSGDDDPREIDLDVSGVRDLIILVDFGSNLDISDHLDLANARLIK